MFAFGLLPPEVNSARMYDGPGSAPLLTAAAGWDALAAELELLGTAYTAVTSALQGEIWSGPASTSMDVAVVPYVRWASTAAHQAAHSAGQARSAAAAFETAFASTVPPPVVAANRTLLATLVATNYFAQNTAAIAATEAAYAEMWAQDAAAMYFYAESSSAAAAFEPFTTPPKTADPSGGSAQAAASSAAASNTAAASQTPLVETLAALSPQAASLETGSAAAHDSSVNSAAVLSTVGDFNTLVGPLTIAYQVPYTAFSGGSFFNGFVQSKVQSTDLSEIAAEDALKADLHASGQSAGPVAAAAGRAAPGRSAIRATELDRVYLYCAAAI